VSRDDSVASNRTVREMEARIRELERQLGRKMLEVEILKEALEKARSKKPILHALSPRPEIPGDGNCEDPGRVALEPERQAERGHQAASALSDGAVQALVVVCPKPLCGLVLCLTEPPESSAPLPIAHAAE